MADQGLPIDVTDPEDIRRKMPALQRLHEQKRLKLEEMMDEIRNLERLMQSLAALTKGGEARPPNEDDEAGPSVRAEAVRRARVGTSSPAQDAAIAALRQAGEAMGPADLFRFMEERKIRRRFGNPNVLGAALWAAERRGRLGKTDDGRYLLPEWGLKYLGRPITDYGKMPPGFPQPAAPTETNPYLGNEE